MEGDFIEIENYDLKCNQEINWFNEKEKDNKIKVGSKIFKFYKVDLIPTNKAKTKLIASIRKDYDKAFLKNLTDAGLRIFRINGAYFNCKEYEKLVEGIKELFKNTNDRPTFIFDLKGPIPRISKLGVGKNKIDVRKDQLIKILHENPKIEEPDIIHVDKKIIQFINIGDRILIDSSKCILKVISIERFKRKNSISKLSGHKSSHKLTQRISEIDFEENELFIGEENQFANSNINYLPTIHEEGDMFHIDDNLDFSIEERLIHKQNTMQLAYQNIINKHKNYNDLHKFNESAGISLDASQDSLRSTEDENRIYLEKRERIRSSIASSNTNKSNNMILCEVSHTGSIYLHKKLFLLEKEIVSELKTSPIGVKDIVDLHKAINLGINIITVLVNKAENIDEIKELIGDKHEDILIFSRIETSEAIYNFDSILQKSDGIIIQQGLLSSKIAYEDLCLIEAYMIEKCKIMQKPIFMQTNILKSMTHRVKPLVTEVSNIDHAVNAGIDGLILKEEITMAENHNQIINILKEILPQVEALADTKLKYEELSKFFKLHREVSIDPTIESLLDCAVKSTFDLDIGLIILFTDYYKLAKTLSKYRPKCRIVCVTKEYKFFNFLRLIRGVSPFLFDNFNGSKLKNEEFTVKIIQLAKERQLLTNNSSMVLVVNAYTNRECIYKNGMSFFDTGN